MSRFDFDKRKQLQEDEGGAPAAAPCVPGGAYPSCPVTAPFQTLTNTVGIGNPVFGGSDRFDRVIGSKIQKKKKTK